MNQIRYIFLGCIFLLIPINSYCQIANDPFKGTIHCGSGVSTLIDFNLENSGVSIPLQFGIGVTKYLSSTKYLGFGFALSSRGTGHRQRNETQYGTSTTWYRLTLWYLDLPISYNTSSFRIKRSDAYLVFGLRNSMLIKPPAIRSALDIDEAYFRNYALSVYTGVTFKRSRNFNWSITINQSVISIVKPEFKEEIKLQNEGYSAYAYPVEILVSIAYIIN